MIVCLLTMIVCLFTCASTRAVHLELTQGLTVQAFLLEFRRSVAEDYRARLYQTTQTLLKPRSKELQTISRSEEVLRHLRNYRITWNPSQRWWSGLFESIGFSTLTLYELNTLLVEVEGVLNTRIKNYVYDDEQSISYPPTPSYTINGRRIESLTNSEHFQIIRTNNILTKRARHKKKLLQQFTCIQWQKGYDGILREDAILK